MVQGLTYTKISDLWKHIARMRKAAGDKEGARIAYRNARVYEGRTLVSSLHPETCWTLFNLSPRRPRKPR